MTWRSCVQSVVSSVGISSSSPSSTFPGGDELPWSLGQSVPAVLFILILLKESVVYAQQLVRGGSGQRRRLALGVLRRGEGLPLRRRGLGTEGVLAGGRVRAHAVDVRSGGQGHCSKGSVGRLWGAHLSFCGDEEETQDRGE